MNTLEAHKDLLEYEVKIRLVAHAISEALVCRLGVAVVQLSVEGIAVGEIHATPRKTYFRIENLWCARLPHGERQQSGERHQE
jgi:hypothetical protein